MKALVVLVLSAGMLACGAPGDRGIGIPKSGRVVVRDSHFDQVAFIHRMDDLRFVVASVQGARKIGDSSTVSHGYSHKIDLDRRWLYDVGTGDLVRLTMRTTPVYRIREEDRARFDRLIRNDGG